MFGNLVESGSHLSDLKRRSSFFLGTLVFYTALMLAAGVGSIYAYNVSLDEQAELELTTMLRFAPQAAPPEEEPQRRHVEPRRATTAPASGDTRPFRAAVVTEEVRNNPNLSNRPAARTDAPEIPDGQPVEIGPANIPAIGGGVNPANQGTNAHGVPGGRLVPPDTEEVPERRAHVEPPQTQPETQRRTLNLSQGVIAGKATHKPSPVYPDLAKKARASGTVAVQVLVDEQGRVLSAQATGGHHLLRKAAVEAALRARFSPTLLSNQPVKVTGIINYNFVLN